MECGFVGMEKLVELIMLFALDLNENREGRYKEVEIQKFAFRHLYCDFLKERRAREEGGQLGTNGKMPGGNVVPPGKRKFRGATNPR